MVIINLTQAPASAEQTAAGVVDLTGAALEALKAALTVDAWPNEREIRERARFIAGLVGGDSIVAKGLRAEHAMIGVDPWLMAPLAAELRAWEVEPVFGPGLSPGA